MKTQWKITDQFKQRVSLCHIGLVRDQWRWRSSSQPTLFITFWKSVEKQQLEIK